jgi:hypothetical protein
MVPARATTTTYLKEFKEVCKHLDSLINVGDEKNTSTEISYFGRKSLSDSHVLYEEEMKVRRKGTRLK